MVMKALREGAKGGITKFILFSFLVLATAGLVLMDVGGVFRGGVGSSDIAVVGKEKISIVSFDRTVRSTLPRLGLTTQDAFKLGYINQLLGSEIRGRLLSQAAKDTGILIPERRIAETVQKTVEPYTLDGMSPKEALERILLNQGMSEQMLVNAISRDMGNSLLSESIQGSSNYFAENLQQDLYRHQKEKRDVEYITFLNSDIKDVPKPTEEQLRSLYLVSQENYAEAEMRRFKLVTIKTDELKKTLEISEEEIKQAYEDNIDYYTTPVTRKLDQALFNTQEDAQAAVAALKNGKSLEDAAKSISSQTVGYLGEKDFLESELIEEIKDDALIAKKGDIIGPLQSDLGWYVVVIKKITDKHTKSFAAVKDEIRNEILETELMDEEYNLANTVDDLLASGASLEEVAEQVDLSIQTLPAVNRYGQKEDGKDGLKDYAALKATIIETGFQLEEGETSAVFETQDGKFRAVYLHHLKPKTYKSFEDVKSDLAKRWTADQKRVSGRVIALQALDEIIKSGGSLQSYASANGKTIMRKNAITRHQDPDGPLTMRSVSNIFEAPIDAPILLDVENGYALTRVTGFSWPSSINEQGKDFKALQKSLAESARNEALGLYLQEKQNKFGAKINQALLERVYGPESQSY